MKNNELYLIDMKFNERGHYFDDLKEFSPLFDKYVCKYYAPVGKDVFSDLKTEFKTRKTGMLFLFEICKILFMKRNEKIVFLSCSFIPLLLISLLCCNFNYIFRVHSLPVVKVGLYKKVIYFISVFSRSTVFLDYPVRDYFVDNKISCRNKSICIIGRALPQMAKSKCTDTDSTQRYFRLSFVGALNDEKDLSPIVNFLKKEKIDGLRLSFFSKGLSKYRDDLDTIAEIYPDTEISDSFLDRHVYDQVIQNADALILPYRKSYGVRFSAVLNDALRQGKKVLTVKLPQFEYYSTRYNACFLYTDEQDLGSAIYRLMESGPLREESLIADYSHELKLKQFSIVGL